MVLLLGNLVLKEVLAHHFDILVLDKVNIRVLVVIWEHIIIELGAHLGLQLLLFLVFVVE